MAPAALLLQAIDDIGQGKVDELSLRGVNIGDAGAQTLCHALRGNASITSLDLYDALLGEEGCLAVAQARQFGLEQSETVPLHERAEQINLVAGVDLGA